MIGEMFTRSLLISLLSLLFIPTVFGQGITWHTNLDEAKKLAQKTGKPLMYDFTAQWCGPCRRMDKEFWPRADVVELSTQFVCVKVNFDTEKAFAAKYSIRAIPNVVFTDPWGRGLLGQKGFGAGTDKEIFEKIKLLPKDFGPLLEAGNRLETDEKNLDALHQFAQFYQERKFFWLGNQFYQRLLMLEAEPSKRESILLNLAFNHIRMNENEEATQKLQNLRTEYPKSPQNDLYLYGLVIAHKTDQRGWRFVGELKRNFPKSQYIALAEEALGPVTGRK